MQWGQQWGSEWRPIAYLATKAPRGKATAQRLREAGFVVGSSWVNWDGEPTAQLWSTIVSDMRGVDCLVLDVQEGDVLRGCLVEVGLALAGMRPVYVVGDCESLRADGASDSSFMMHPLVHRVRDFADAMRHFNEKYPYVWRARLFS